ncbi:cystathionine gamma-synthase [Glutamicibacter protophormiae]|uniref:Cystathionine gamma-synthase n=1 Tax=Glutamicibacter protophormiae TaxID=37930 RepID=A0ABS4XQ15_GLUPR|nr:cystathionine gamma-synthase [Glutamicibacter protophormiae]MBP2398597.1 cystathionine gamma-synthase [Glutamicibacter protophormiae]GGL80907.1 cystathionine gamma-synthase [Glutamicibacter protophormiae]
MSGFNTLAVHAGQEKDPHTGAVIPPIYQTSTFIQDGINVLRAGHEYSRGSNPTRNGFEAQLTALEGGAAGFSFASGIAAEDALLRALLAPGDHIVLGADGYGGTNRLITRLHHKWGITASAVDITNLDAVRAALRPNTALLWVETPSNPLLGIADLAGWAAIAAEHGALLVVDNTFATPYLQRPLDFGAHAVVHSTTKYIGGHSDVLGGAVIVADHLHRGQSLAEAVGYQQFAGGAVSGPQDSYLAARGLKTLGLRMERHCATASTLAGWLDDRPEVARVYYPGLESHPGHELAKRQQRGFGGILSLQLADESAARAFAESMEYFQLSVSLGGVESLVCYPREMTHASLIGTPLEIPANLVRLSVGIEEPEDLIADLELGLAAAEKASGAGSIQHRSLATA